MLKPFMFCIVVLGPFDFRSSTTSACPSSTSTPSTISIQHATFSSSSTPQGDEGYQGWLSSLGMSSFLRNFSTIDQSEMQQQQQETSSIADEVSSSADGYATPMTHLDNEDSTSSGSYATPLNLPGTPEEDDETQTVVGDDHSDLSFLPSSPLLLMTVREMERQQLPARSAYVRPMVVPKIGKTVSLDAPDDDEIQISATGDLLPARRSKSSSGFGDEIAEKLTSDPKTLVEGLTRIKSLHEESLSLADRMAHRYQRRMSPQLSPNLSPNPTLRPPLQATKARSFDESDQVSELRRNLNLQRSFRGKSSKQAQLPQVPIEFQERIQNMRQEAAELAERLQSRHLRTPGAPRLTSSSAPISPRLAPLALLEPDDDIIENRSSRSVTPKQVSFDLPDPVEEVDEENILDIASPISPTPSSKSKASLKNVKHAIEEKYQKLVSKLSKLKKGSKDKKKLRKSRSEDNISLSQIDEEVEYEKEPKKLERKGSWRRLFKKTSSVDIESSPRSPAPSEAASEESGASSSNRIVVIGPSDPRSSLSPGSSVQQLAQRLLQPIEEEQHNTPEQQVTKPLIHIDQPQFEATAYLTVPTIKEPTANEGTTVEPSRVMQWLGTHHEMLSAKSSSETAITYVEGDEEELERQHLEEEMKLEMMREEEYQKAQVEWKFHRLSQQYRQSSIESEESDNRAEVEIKYQKILERYALKRQVSDCSAEVGSLEKLPPSKQKMSWDKKAQFSLDEGGLRFEEQQKLNQSTEHLFIPDVEQVDSVFSPSSDKSVWKVSESKIFASTDEVLQNFVEASSLSETPIETFQAEAPLTTSKTVKLHKQYALEAREVPHPKMEVIPFDNDSEIDFANPTFRELPEFELVTDMQEELEEMDRDLKGRGVRTMSASLIHEKTSLSKALSVEELRVFEMAKPVANKQWNRDVSHSQPAINELTRAESCENVAMFFGPNEHYASASALRVPVEPRMVTLKAEQALQLSSEDLQPLHSADSLVDVFSPGYEDEEMPVATLSQQTFVSSPMHNDGMEQFYYYHELSAIAEEPVETASASSIPETPFFRPHVLSCISEGTEVDQKSRPSSLITQVETDSSSGYADEVAESNDSVISSKPDRQHPAALPSVLEVETQSVGEIPKMTSPKSAELLSKEMNVSSAFETSANVTMEPKEKSPEKAIEQQVPMSTAGTNEPEVMETVASVGENTQKPAEVTSRSHEGLIVTSSSEVAVSTSVAEKTTKISSSKQSSSTKSVAQQQVVSAFESSSKTNFEKSTATAEISTTGSAEKSQVSLVEVTKLKSEDNSARKMVQKSGTEMVITSSEDSSTVSSFSKKTEAMSKAETKLTSHLLKIASPSETVVSTMSAAASETAGVVKTSEVSSVQSTVEKQITSAIETSKTSKSQSSSAIAQVSQTKADERSKVSKVEIVEQSAGREIDSQQSLQRGGTELSVSVAQQMSTHFATSVEQKTVTCRTVEKTSQIVITSTATMSQSKEQQLSDIATTSKVSTSMSTSKANEKLVTAVSTCFSSNVGENMPIYSTSVGRTLKHTSEVEKDEKEVKDMPQSIAAKVTVVTSEAAKHHTALSVQQGFSSSVVSSSKSQTREEQPDTTLDQRQAATFESNESQSVKTSQLTQLFKVQPLSMDDDLEESVRRMSLDGSIAKPTSASVVKEQQPVVKQLASVCQPPTVQYFQKSISISSSVDRYFDEEKQEETQPSSEKEILAGQQKPESDVAKGDQATIESTNVLVSNQGETKEEQNKPGYQMATSTSEVTTAKQTENVVVEKRKAESKSAAISKTASSKEIAGDKTAVTAKVENVEEKVREPASQSSEAKAQKAVVKQSSIEEKKKTTISRTTVGASKLKKSLSKSSSEEESQKVAEVGKAASNNKKPLVKQSSKETVKKAPLTKQSSLKQDKEKSPSKEPVDSSKAQVKAPVSRQSSSEKRLQSSGKTETGMTKAVSKKEPTETTETVKKVEQAKQKQGSLEKATSEKPVVVEKQKVEKQVTGVETAVKSKAEMTEIVSKNETYQATVVSGKKDQEKIEQKAEKQGEKSIATGSSEASIKKNALSPEKQTPVAGKTEAKVKDKPDLRAEESSQSLYTGKVEVTKAETAIQKKDEPEKTVAGVDSESTALKSTQSASKTAAALETKVDKKTESKKQELSQISKSNEKVEETKKASTSISKVESEPISSSSVETRTEKASTVETVQKKAEHSKTVEKFEKVSLEKPSEKQSLISKQTKLVKQSSIEKVKEEGKGKIESKHQQGTTKGDEAKITKQSSVEKKTPTSGDKPADSDKAAGKSEADKKLFEIGSVSVTKKEVEKPVSPAVHSLLGATKEPIQPYIQKDPSQMLTKSRITKETIVDIDTLSEEKHPTASSISKTGTKMERQELSTGISIASSKDWLKNHYLILVLVV